MKAKRCTKNLKRELLFSCWALKTHARRATLRRYKENENKKVSAPILSHGLLETHLSHQISGPSQTPLECALVAVFDIDSRGLHYHSTVTLTAMEMLATGSGRGVRMPSQDRMYYWLDNPSKDGIYHGPSP